MTKQLTCAITGHRPNHFRFGYDETDLDCLKLKIALRTQILKMIDLGVTQFLSGMALGVDMWAAQMVLVQRNKGLPIKLTCVLPCETQADHWQEDDHACYLNILQNADEVLYTGIEYTDVCMYERNKYLVEHCDYLLAVFDGIPKGGTAQTIQFAQRLNIPVTTINPNTFLVKSTSVGK